MPNLELGPEQLVAFSLFWLLPFQHVSPEGEIVRQTWLSVFSDCFTEREAFAEAIATTVLRLSVFSDCFEESKDCLRFRKVRERLLSVFSDCFSFLRKCYEYVGLEVPESFSLFWLLQCSRSRPLVVEEIYVISFSLFWLLLNSLTITSYSLFFL